MNDVDVCDCSSLSFTSGIGTFTQIKDECIPLDKPNFIYPPDFAKKFNQNSISAIEFYKKREENQYIKNTFDSSPYLFFCENLHPKAITCYFFQPQTYQVPYFISFFPPSTLEFVSLSESIHYLFSRIALPFNTQQLSVILHAFADAYVTANHHILQTKEEIVQLTVASLLLSINKCSDSLISSNIFLSYLGGVNATKEFKTTLYESIKSNPIPLFFTFVDTNQKINFDKTGCLTCFGGLLKRKKKFYIKLTSSSIQSFRDKEKKVLRSDIPLDDVVITYFQPQGKEQAHFVVKRSDEKSFGQNYSKGKPKDKKSNQYTFYSSNDNEIKEWVNVLKLVTFYHVLETMLK